MELNYDKLGERETEIVKKQVKSQYNRLKFRKYAELSKYVAGSGSYKKKLHMVFEKEMDNERLFYAYVYNLLRPSHPIIASDMEADINDKMFEIGVPIGQLADRLKDSIWMTKKRIQDETKQMQNAINLLEDQILLKSEQQVLSDADKEQVKNTIISMINYVCETKKLLLDEVLKEDEQPMFDFASLNPFGKPLQIQIVENEQNTKQSGGKNKRRMTQYTTNVIKRHLRKTKRRRA